MTPGHEATNACHWATQQRTFTPVPHTSHRPLQPLTPCRKPLSCTASNESCKSKRGFLPTAGLCWGLGYLPPSSTWSMVHLAGMVLGPVLSWSACVLEAARQQWWQNRESTGVHGM